MQFVILRNLQNALHDLARLGLGYIRITVWVRVRARFGIMVRVSFKFRSEILQIADVQFRNCAARFANFTKTANRKQQ